MTWFDDGGNTPPHEPVANHDRVRCAACGQYPTLTTKGRLRNHHYPWYHSQHGTPCPGSGTLVRPPTNQLSIPTEETP